MTFILITIINLNTQQVTSIKRQHDIAGQLQSRSYYQLDSLPYSSVPRPEYKGSFGFLLLFNRLTL